MNLQKDTVWHTSGGTGQVPAQSGCRSARSGPFAEDGGTLRVENIVVGGSGERVHKL